MAAVPPHKSPRQPPFFSISALSPIFIAATKPKTAPTATYGAAIFAKGKATARFLGPVLNGLFPNAGPW